MTDVVRHDDPRELARRVAALPRPIVIGIDVDGVLAPIVPHAADARLGDGVARALSRLQAVDGVEVAVVSGRSLDGLTQFDFPAELQVIGGHGGEIRGQVPPALTETERSRYNLLDRLATQAAATAGGGAWVERKPASVVLHTRQADPTSGRQAIAGLAAAVAALGAETTPGSEVLELFARPATKARAVEWLRARFSPAAMVYLGDDVTDEDAFLALGPGDVAIKIGDGSTAAGFRLAGTEAVAVWLDELLPALDAA